MEQRLTMITLGVKNLKKSASFYEQKLGWQRIQPEDENIVFYKLNGIILALFPSDKLAEDAGTDSKGSGFKNFTLSHNLGSEQEVDKLFRQLAAKGVKIIKEPQKVFWGGYSGYFADPDNNLWEVAYNPFMSLTNAINEGIESGIEENFDPKEHLKKMKAGRK